MTSSKKTAKKYLDRLGEFGTVADLGTPPRAKLALVRPQEVSGGQPTRKKKKIKFRRDLTAEGNVLRRVLAYMSEGKKVHIFWSSNQNIREAVSDARLRALVEFNTMYYQFIANADNGWGTAFFIDALNERGARKLLSKAIALPGHSNVLYAGKNAKKLLSGS